MSPNDISVKAPERATLRRMPEAVEEGTEPVVNGPAAAAILAAGIGSFVLGILSLLGDAFDAIGKALNFYNPSGTLSGVTTIAIVVWLVAWFALARRWDTRTVTMAKINLLAFVGLAAGLLLTFPPFMDLLQGK
jgi:hypothetical protein